VRIRNNAGQETAGSIFRVRMCFGRGLVLLDQPITVREKEVLTLITKAWALSQWSKMRPSMGITYIEGTVTGPAGSQTLDFLVDSGAAYSLLPYDIWTAVGLAPKRTLSFALGDGSRIERNVSECHIAFSMGDGYSPVILGEPGDSALLGVVTLENLGLVCNPFSRTLHPMKLLLA
jgi:predicted aspartyl protease